MTCCYAMLLNSAMRAPFTPLSSSLQTWTKDLKDSECYSTLLNQLNPAQCAIVTGSDPLERATQVCSCLFSLLLLCALACVPSCPHIIATSASTTITTITTIIIRCAPTHSTWA